MWIGESVFLFFILFFNSKINGVLNKNSPSHSFTTQLIIKRSSLFFCQSCLWPYVDMGQNSEWCYSIGGCDNTLQALRRPRTSMPFFAPSDIMWRPPAGLPAANQPTVRLCLCVRRGAFILTAPVGNSSSAHLYVSWWVQGHSWKAECVKVFSVENRVDVSAAACFL